ncbi:MAG: helix-turn-helix transcriptional regulator [Planctomycetes bacterium]|nr:helix-turn-helix transcriptional regulator [Planctomycetota bacterium]
MISPSPEMGKILLTGSGRDSGTGPGMRTYPDYALVYVLEGHAAYSDANGLELILAAGDVILVFPSLPHRYQQAPNKSWVQIFLTFNGPIFKLWGKSGLLDGRCPIYHVEPVEYWHGRIKSVLNTPGVTGTGPAWMEVCRLQMLLADMLADERARSVSTDDTQWLRKACGLLENPGRGGPDWNRLARQLDCSYENFRKRFRRLAGFSPAQYRARKTIELACRMIQQSRTPAKQIAYRLGFSDEAHFSHRFRQITGKSPRQFRKSLMLPPGD